MAEAPRILVVDDSHDVRELLTAGLRSAGYQVITASDGEEAITVAQSRHPDVILMDVVMKGMDGFRATRELSKDPATASIPVVMVTTKNQESDKMWGLRQGAVDYLTKPFADDELVAAVQASLS